MKVAMMGANPITAIADNSVLTVAICKQHIRKDINDEDFIIGLYLQAAWSRADAYCQNPFLDTKGRQRDIPSDVEIWCLQFVSLMYENRTLGLSSEVVTDLGSVKYAKESDLDIDYRLLKPWRLDVGYSSTF